jgi:short subunit dehydrogenase-like uncharacterized protein
MTVQPRDKREFELVLFGATGFTGRLVAEYLTQQKPAGLRWALGGRSLAKLEAVRAQLGQLDPQLLTLPLLVADSSDASGLAAIAGRSRVICSTVGPYALHGQPLVRACAEQGTDYCDLTGEVPFVRDTIDRCHQTAQQTGARIVPCCGFDSLPSDLGVHLLYEHFAAQGMQLASAKYYLEASKGGISGGTLASMFNLFEQTAHDPVLRRLLADPYALNPDRDRDRGPDGGDQMGVAWDSAAGRFTGPFVMAAVNSRVVRRSNALRSFAYGRDFRYSEVMGFGSGPGGLLKATAITAGVGGFFAAASIPPLRDLLRRRLAQSGEGPSREQRDAGFFTVRIVGKSQRESSAAARRATVLIKGHHDGGYGETSRMIGEAALCLARDQLPVAGGVLTSAVCLGTPLVERLRKSGMIWEVSPGQ